MTSAAAAPVTENNNSNADANNNNSNNVADASEFEESSYEKAPGKWLALESNPQIANKFAQRMGLPAKTYEFVDIYGLDAELLAFVPQPVVAVMLLRPSGVAIKKYGLEQQEKLANDPNHKIADGLFYMYQHGNKIGNACGTIALIHAIASLTHPESLAAPFELVADSPLANFIKASADMDWTERGWELIRRTDIREASDVVANDSSNQTITPERHEKVHAHFIAFICIGGHIYEMDGGKKFPINHGPTEPPDFLAKVGGIVKEKFMAIDPTNLNFNLMALAAAQ
jgi:ubiquitin carboxyl-terminal hydrolase L3